MCITRSWSKGNFPELNFMISLKLKTFSGKSPTFVYDPLLFMSLIEMFFICCSQHVQM